MMLRVLTLRVNGVFTPTTFGDWVISSVGLFAATPTSPNAVETQRLPSWKPVCGVSWLFEQSLARTPRPAPGGGVAAPPPLLPPLFWPLFWPPLFWPPLFWPPLFWPPLFWPLFWPF